MSKKVENPQDVVVAEAVSKTEAFFEKNGKLVIVALVALVVLVAGGYAYKTYVLDRNKTAAEELIVEAQERFAGETPDYALALNGDETGAGFLDVVEQYGSTPSGNLAKHYAGICYLHLGELDLATEYLAKYKAVKGLAGAVVNAQNYGLRGDIAVEQGNYEAAVKLYKKAVAAADNNYTAPLYLYKQGLALVALGKEAEAKACFETITTEYQSSMESREAERMLGL